MVSAAPSLLNSPNNDSESSVINKVGSKAETVLYGRAEDNILCSIETIKSIVKDTDLNSIWIVVEKLMENGANRIKACRENAGTDEEEIA